MKTFRLHRTIDATGTSGTGYVAEGVEFTDGSCALRWLTENTSWAVYRSAADLVAIHGHGGSTMVEFDTEAEEQRLYVVQANKMHRALQRLASPDEMAGVGITEEMTGPAAAELHTRMRYAALHAEEGA